MLTLSTLVAAHGFLPFNETSKKEAMDSLNTGFEPFRKLAPDTGAYMNEVSSRKLSNLAMG
jgi:hypothetical protein